MHEPVRIVHIEPIDPSLFVREWLQKVPTQSQNWGIRGGVGFGFR
ncbi:hypothetical protein OAU86_04000 [Balneolaceae bacterium]|nr:hypothetical protein [Balneolaceae bacterium]